MKTTITLLIALIMGTALRADTLPSVTTTLATNTVTTVSNNVTIITTTITTTIVSNAPVAVAATPSSPTGTDLAKAKPVSPPPPRPAWQSVASFGASVAKGNANSVLLTAAFTTEKKTPENETSLGADAAYGEQNAVESVDRLHAFGQGNHLYSPRFYSYARLDALHDGIAGIDYQFTASPGAGYYFIKNTNSTLVGEVGPGIAIERLGDVDDTYATMRLFEKYDHKFNSQVHTWESVEFLPDAGLVEKFSLNMEVGVETTITKSLSLKTMLQDNYVNLPAAGRKDNDVKLVSGISYKF